MKPLWKIVLIITCIASVACCVLLLRSTSSEPKKDIATARYRVSYDYAKSCILSYYSKYKKDSLVTAFTIERQDFLQTLGIDSVTAGQLLSKYLYVRGYMGLDTALNKFHIFFTPVEGVLTDSTGNILYGGRDVILRGKYLDKNYQGTRSVKGINRDGEDEGEFVMDLNAPCPTTCGFTSAFPPLP